MNRWVVARANVIQGHLSNSSRVSDKNSKLSNLSPYARTAPVAEKAVSYGGEVGLCLKGFVSCDKMPDVTPFFRYEYYNPQEHVVMDKYCNTPADTRLKTNMWVAGVNYQPLPYLVVKADYTKRKIGSGAYNDENEFALGVAFTGWFLSDRTVKDLRARRQLKNQQQTIDEMNSRLEQMQQEIEALRKGK